ncbi:transcriptional regulator containing PAS, AAA-type ATPase, and DNA-binding domains [Desulfosporosinus orientis DSM 765]|uniref:Transcriptional regulator containing PAS, AAA-type ATPase, and DNA-binding domains n=1 Tax=Desulfosporosinus orientis (strain ATCC 19365 / DSM 765 / NCIMB 8382 / VKM B-1628 / Singapore I) TaxID=768706 RepID=G7WEK5_DESOD|nr:sigma-54-dependent Fis family transcriptional regulator [Desulfosporosinus orientis]AET66896.1 transcriptional regulator containing PAS, AAA-type ATPase, and DNA-binding domains [Desulfosporosinus orientis DSM 765]
MISCIHAVTTSFFPRWDPELLFKILNNIHDVVLVVDSDTTIVFANEAYAKILGVPVAKVLGRRLDKIEPKAKTIEVLRTGESSYCRQSYLSSLSVNVVGSTFPLYNGKNIIGCVSIFKNINDVVELNRELNQTKGVADYLKEQLEQEEQLPNSFEEYIGRNSRLKETLKLAAKVAKTDSTVLILGESGVGKEVLARVVHKSSTRKNRPMIKVNCAAIPEDLIESELFGYEDGAFTGAKKGGKLGKFELAHRGTIFLDEIGDMSLTMQAKLLRTLQEKEFERIGGTKAIKVDIRVIAATNRNLEQMIEQGAFRSDLYYRLNIVPLMLIPLRERRDDILELAKVFLKQFAKEVGHELTLSPQVERILRAYEWPGNIRELKNVLEHASIVCSSKVITSKHLPAHIIPKKHRSSVKENSYDIKEIVASVEKEVILSALNACNNNRTDALKALGISRKSFYNKLHQYGIIDV